MAEAQDNRRDGQRLDDLLSALEDFERELEAARADDDMLNVFEVLGITNTEIRHSNVIAWLMRPGGNHGLGGAVLSALIEHAGSTAPERLDDFRIMRESDNIDILAVSAENRMTLAIENKVWSGEHDDQLSRYQGIVERRYPDWEHLYLFLSPFGTPPERDADREVWATIDYRVLLGMIDGAVAEAEITDKARMLIGDYVDSVRRHIVGDESLQERCVEIYLEHKRAIDLIMKNLPDTTKTVHQYALEWARSREGVIVVDGCSRGKAYVRFRTEALEQYLPAVDAQDSWGENYFWFYEIETSKPRSGVGCTLKMQLSCYLPKKNPLPEDRHAATIDYINAFAHGDSGTFFGTYNGCSSRRIEFDPGQISYEDICDACEDLWDDFLRREQLAIEAVFC